MGQLTYASFDARGAARGGWQVKEAVGLPPEVTPEQVVDRVVTTLDPGVPIPAYPTAEERRLLPRRVLFAHLAGHPAWWSSVPAGPDASGRQGNVFTHVVVGAGPSRPAALVASSDWLAPFGAAEVAAASVGQPPAPVDLVARAQYFLDHGPGWPLGTLGVLADAVAAALQDGPVVAVLTESTAEAAEWVGALSLCCSPRTSATISFATLERAATAATWALDGLTLVFLPRLDAEAARGLPNVVVIDPLGDVVVAEPGAYHETGTGQTVPATEWSALLMDQLGTTSELVRVVDELDWIAAQVGDDDLSPVWPLAMRGALEQRVGTEQVVAQALLRTTPDRVSAHPELHQTVQLSIRRQMGASTPERWSALVGMTSGSPAVLQVAALVYAEAAVADLGWLAQPGDPCLPADQIRPGLTPQAVAAVRQGVGGLSRLGLLDGARAGIHLLGLLEVLGWWPEPRLAGLREQLLDVVLDGLRSPAAADLVRSSGSLRPGVAAIIEWGLRLAVMPGEGPLGTRIPPESMHFIGLGENRLDDQSWVLQDQRPTALAAELAIWLLRAGTTSDHHRRAARYLAAEALMREGPGQDPSGAVGALLSQETFTSWDLSLLVRGFGAAWEQQAVAALLREPASTDLDSLAASVLGSWGFSPPARDLAEMRSRTGRLAQRLPTLAEVELVRSAVNHALGGDSQGLDPGLVEQLQLGSLAGLLRGEPESAWVHELTVPMVGEEQITQVAAELAPVLPAAEALVALSHYHPQSPELVAPAATATWLGAWTADDEQLVLDRLLVAVLAPVADTDLYHVAERTSLGRADKFVSRWLQKNRPRRVRDRLGSFFGER
ncbi:MAG: hypothetical protein Q4G45_00290 [Actinomycetia bacterium]|nr:hypothetical protein [Actinomycetes bacterium]